MASSNSPSPSRSPRRRRKWLRRLGVVVVLLVVVGLAPRLISLTPLPGIIASRALSDLQGTVRVGGTSLGWFAPVVLEDVEVYDEAGRPLLAAPRIESSKTLLALLRDRSDLGGFRIERPSLQIVCSAGQSNLEQALAHWLRPGEKTGTAGGGPSRTGFRVEVMQARLAIQDEDGGREWTIELVDGSLSLPQDSHEPLRFALHGVIPSAEQAGRLDVELSVQRTKGEGTIRIESFPLSLAELFLHRLEPAARLDGRLNAQLVCAWDEEPAAASLEGQVSAQRLVLSGPWLREELRLDRLELPCRVTVQASQVQVERAELRCDVGSASVAGTFDASADVNALLRQPGCQATVDLDLARLAALLPRTLHLQQDTRITSGRLLLSLASSTGSEGVVWEGKLHASDLQGTHQGQAISWPEPLSLTFAARPTPDALPVIDRLRCDSDFLQLEGSGSADRLELTARCNLDRLSERLSRFVDLGPMRPAGQGWTRLSAQRDEQGAFRLEGETQVRQLRLAAPRGGSLQEDSLVLRLDLTGRSDGRGLQRIDTAGLRLQAGPDEVTLTLLEPMADLSRDLQGSAQVHLKGDLARWHARLRPWVDLLDGWQMSGPAELTARLRSSADAVEADDVKLVARDLRFRGLGLSLEEPALDLRAALRWQPASGRLELKDARLECPSLTAHCPSLILAPDQAGALTLAGGGDVRGNLARLQCWLQDPDPAPDAAFAGTLAGRVSLQSASGRLGANLDVALLNFVCGLPRDPVWQEPRLQVVGHVHYDPAADSVQIEQVRIDGAALSCTAAGKLARLSSRQDLTLAGQLQYDLEKLEPRLRPYLGKGVEIRGRDSRPFRLEMCLASAAPAGPSAVRLDLSQPAGASMPLACVKAEGELAWKSVRAHGCDLGPAVVKARLADGWLHAAPIEATLNRGRLRLEPHLRLEPGPLELHLEKGKVLERGRITPAMCDSALAYVLPVLARVSEADGELSLELDRARILLDAPERSDVAGRLIVHSARIGPSPLVRELGVLLKGPATVTLARDMAVPFWTASGRVHHRDLVLRFPDLTVRTHGSVGFDGSLALVAEMPVPPKWLGSSRLAGALANQTIRLPITGTLSQPKLDDRALRAAIAQLGRDAAGEALRQEVESQLDKILRPKK